MRYILRIEVLGKKLSPPRQPRAPEQYTLCYALQPRRGCTAHVRHPSPLSEYRLPIVPVHIPCAHRGVPPSHTTRRRSLRTRRWGEVKIMPVNRSPHASQCKRRSHLVSLGHSLATQPGNAGRLQRKRTRAEMLSSLSLSHSLRNAPICEYSLTLCTFARGGGSGD